MRNKLFFQSKRSIGSPVMIHGKNVVGIIIGKVHQSKCAMTSLIYFADFINATMTNTSSVESLTIEKMELDDFSYHAKIYESDRHYGNGALISSKYVLTGVWIQDQNMYFTNFSIELEATGKNHSVKRVFYERNSGKEGHYSLGFLEVTLLNYGVF